MRNIWLREKESNLQLRVQSPTCCRLHHPTSKQLRGTELCPEKGWSRRQELNRHRSIINRVLWPLSYTAMVDPTGFKPAPHGLKGRCSVTRAPGQEIGCGGRIRTFDSRINNAAPYQLGYATRLWLRRRESISYHLVYKTSALEAD
jgi:hypothetical protein